MSGRKPCSTKPGEPRWRMAGGLIAALLLLGNAPAFAQMLVGDGSLRCGAPYVVARGDTLSGIAKRAYGDPALYRVLLDMNHAALGGDPAHLAIGMSLTLPCVEADGVVLTAEEAEKAAAAMETVVALQGPLAPAELDTLLGPVALFPDALLAPVLVATTFPIDVVKAARFVEASADLPDKERAARAADQPWDNSVRELAAGFPDLVTRMSDHIDWTEQAGEAVMAQTDEVLASIQRLREKARANGYLVDTEAQKVTEVNDKIMIEPATPGVVHVPTYDSKVVYTTPVTGPPPYHYSDGSYGYVYHDDDDWDDVLLTGGIILGGAVILDEIFDDDDWDGWDGDDDIDWDRGDITIDRGDINIDRDEINIGDGDRSGIADGGRLSIGDNGRAQVDRIEARREAASEGPTRRSVSNPAKREVAREQIEKRKSTGARPAELGTTRKAPAVQRQPERARPAATPRNPGAVRAPVNRAPAVRAPERPRSVNRPSRPPASRGGGQRRR